MPRLKLNNFKDNTTLESFINHLETVPTLDKVVFVVDNTTLLLDVSIVDTNSVKYSIDCEHSFNTYLNKHLAKYFE